MMFPQYQLTDLSLSQQQYQRLLLLHQLRLLYQRRLLLRQYLHQHYRLRLRMGLLLYRMKLQMR
jgi:hypothetical protein